MILVFQEHINVFPTRNFNVYLEEKGFTVTQAKKNQIHPIAKDTHPHVNIYEDIRLEEPEDIFPAYEKAFLRKDGRTTICVESGDYYSIKYKLIIS